LQSTELIFADGGLEENGAFRQGLTKKFSRKTSPVAGIRDRNEFSKKD